MTLDTAEYLNYLCYALVGKFVTEKMLIIHSALLYHKT